MKYSRNYDVTPRPASPDGYLQFKDAIEGIGYKCPKTGDVRVRTGSNGYICFGNNGEMNINVDTSWPQYSVLRSHAVHVNILLTVGGGA